MLRHPWRVAGLSLSVIAAALLCVALAGAQTPKPGGILTVIPFEPPPSLNIHGEAGITTLQIVSPCYNNLVRFDPLKPRESEETIVPDLAERWAWQDGGRALTFTLRKGVKWHDGQPLGARDVKYTFDMVRGAPDVGDKLRVSPRRLWYANVRAIETPDPETVTFRLEHPQPSLLTILAAGPSVVYPAHVPVAELRTKCVGTGPFKLKEEYKLGEYVDYVKNPDYFVKGYPYLDGLRFLLIKDRATQVAALQTGRADLGPPIGFTKTMAETLAKSARQLVVVETTVNGNDELLINVQRPPFTDPRVRRALTLAIDRSALIRGPRQGGALAGGAMLPAPFGVWGLPPEEVKKLSGAGDAAKDKAEARRLLAAAGYGPGTPLKVAVSVRASAWYQDQASFVVDQLGQVGVEVTLDQVDSQLWHAKMSRREYQVAVNGYGTAVDDPDATFLEHFACNSPRNWAGYCSDEIERLFEQQSRSLDPKKRLQLVHEIQRRLDHDGARPPLNWLLTYVVMAPYVKNVVPHQTMYNYHRLQEAWLDK